MSSEPRWFKSSYSDVHGQECLEAALSYSTIRVRDSKLGPCAELSFPQHTWAAFVSSIPDA
ncbi:hypothetical protein GCM10020221_29540 [Streptomyces thioluteus]|uniref:DUF397 domain-containing protein n=1 Tax=Streptomyces thioluteus TaxID=66431 RepID=A0ABN3WYF5_STRTU